MSNFSSIIYRQNAEYRAVLASIFILTLQADFGRMICVGKSEYLPP